MIQCPSFIHDIDVVANGVNRWRITLTSDSFGLEKTKAFQKAYNVKANNREEAIQKTIDEAFYEFHVQSRGRWITAQTLKKYGEARKELFKDFCNKLRDKYGKDYTFANEDGQNEILRCCGIEEMPVKIVEMEEGVLSYSFNL